MRKIRDLYQQNDFAKNLAVVFSGNTLALMVPFILAPFIARLYTPEDFAGFELFVKIVDLIAVVGCLRFEMAIILPKSDEESNQLMKMAIQLLLVISVVTALIVIPARNYIGLWLDNDALPSLLWLVPIGVFLSAMLRLSTQYLIRSQKFKHIAANKMISATGNNGSKYLLGLKFPSSFGLIIGHFVGFIAPLLALIRFKYFRKQLLSLRNVTVPRRQLFKKYKDFPIVNASHAFFDEGQKASLLFFISYFFGATTLGFFAFTWRYLTVPVRVFGMAVAQVLNERMVREYNEGKNIRPLVNKTMLYLFGIAIIPFGALFFFGEWIFTVVFSEAWTIAGTYAEIMAPWLFLHFATAPLSMIPVIVEKQKMSFLITAVGNSITLLLVFFLSLQGFDIKEVIIAVVASHCALLIFQLFWYLKIIERK